MAASCSKIFAVFITAACLAACSDREAGTDNAAQAQISINSIQRDSGLSGEDATFQDLAGNALELSDFTGQKVVINYWATWCAPCIEELPALSRAAGILGPENFIFLLASDESIEVITDFIEDRNFSGNFIKLNTFFAIHGIQAVPSTILYSEEGEELASWLGAYEWDSQELLEQLRNPASIPTL